MTIQDQIDELKKELSGITGELEKKINQLQKQFIIKGSDNKPTRYYPNGAYMDCPVAGTDLFFIDDSGDITSTRSPISNWVESEKNTPIYFPTEEACAKSKRRDDLTANMYRDMRDERINGDWVAYWNDDEYKYFPQLNGRSGEFLEECYCNTKQAHDFYYKKQTFIEDLKALGWTEEELKIVWFRV